MASRYNNMYYVATEARKGNHSAVFLNNKYMIKNEYITSRRIFTWGYK